MAGLVRHPIASCATCGPAMRCACIDIGSNTTRLLVAESRGAAPREVLAQRAFTRLGRGRAAATIPRAKVAEVAEVVAEQVRTARERGVEAMRVVATAAIRGAANRDELCAAVDGGRGRAGRRAPGEEEARLAFLGATRTLQPRRRARSASSTSAAARPRSRRHARPAASRWSASFRVGSGVAGRRATCAPTRPSADELDARARARRAASSRALDAPRADVALAVGGSATSLRRARRRRARRTRALDARRCGVLARAPAAGVAAPLRAARRARARCCPPGCCCSTRPRALGVPAARSRCGGLREGVVLDELAAVGS